MTLLSRLAQIEQEEAYDSAARPQPSPQAEAEVKAEADSIAAAQEQLLQDAHAYAHGDPRGPRALRLPLPTSSLSHSRMQRELADIREQLRISVADQEHQRQLQQLQALALTNMHKSSDGWKAPKDLSSAELGSLACSFEPHAVADWETRVKARLGDKCPDLHGVWAMPEAAWQLCKDQPKLAGANGWASGMMVATIDQSTASGKAFSGDLVRNHTLALTCSRTFLAQANLQKVPKAGPSGRKRAEDFEKMTHLKAGMSDAATTLALHEMQRRWEVLPPASRAREHDLVYRMLEAIPQTSDKLRDKREKMIDELDEAIAAGDPPPWTMAALTARIGVIVASAAPARPEPHTYQQERGGRGRGRGKGAERGRGERSRGRGGRGKPLCDNCGDPDHEWPDCPKFCPNEFCRAKTCPRVRGPSHECTTKMVNFPEIVNNAHGNPYPPPVVRRLRKLNTKYHKGEGNQHEGEEEDAEAEHIEMADHGYETQVIMRGKAAPALHFDEDPYGCMSSVSGDASVAHGVCGLCLCMPHLQSLGHDCEPEVVLARAAASGAEAHAGEASPGVAEAEVNVGEASLRIVGGEAPNLAQEPAARNLGAELQAAARRVRVWATPEASEKLQQLAHRLDADTSAQVLALLRMHFSSPHHLATLAQLLGVEGGSMHCYVGGASVRATLLAAHTVTVTAGTSAGLDGALVATFQPVSEGRVTERRASSRIAEQRPRCLNILYAYVATSAREEGLGGQLVATVEGVAYDMQAACLAAVATPASSAWWLTKQGFKGISYFAARDAGVVSPWSLEEVVLLQRAVFSFEMHAGEADARAGTAGGAATVKLMLDTGSNLNVFSSPAVERVGELHEGRPMEVTGVGALKRTFNRYVSFGVCIGGGAPLPLHGPYSPAGKRDIVSVSALWNEHGIECRFAPRMQLLRQGKVLAAMYEVNGLYFVDAQVSAGAEAHAHEVGTELVSCTLYKGSLSAGDKARLFAVRMHLSKRTLQLALKNVHGHDVAAINKGTMRLIESDTILRRARMRRKPVPRLAQPALKPLPGQHQVMDAHGPARSASPVDGSKYTLHSVDKVTGLSHDAKSTRLGEEMWIGFVLKVISSERRYGHSVLVITIDADPQIPDTILGKLVQEAARFGVTVRRAPGGHHESCADAEQLNDSATRGSEAMLARARKSRAWYVDGRIYFCRNRNLCTSRGRDVSRLEHHTGIKPDVGKLVPYLFGTSMAYVQDEQLRDGKGNLDTRCPHGMLFGIKGSSYLIYTDKGTAISRGADVCAPLDELLLLERGMPEALREEDGEPADVAQQLGEDAQRRGDVPVGGVVYESGDEADEPQVMPPLPGSSASFEPAPARAPAAPKGRRPREPKDYFPPPTRADEDDPTAAGPPSTRLRARVAQAINAVAVIPMQDAERVSMIESCVYTLCGDEAHEQFVAEVSFDGDFEAYAAAVDGFVARGVGDGSFESAVAVHEGAECNKAARNFTEVVTDLGRANLDVPATMQEVRDSPFAEAWKAAIQKSVDVIHHAGCPYMKLSEAEAQGIVIAPCVVQTKLKVDKATGRLAQVDPRKARTALDGAWLKRYRERKRLEKPMSARIEHVEVADDTLIKMQLSEAAPEDEDLAAADLPNAYNLAERRRPPILLKLPELSDKYAADGSECGLLLVVPHYGEEESGDDLDHMIKEEFKAAGLQRAEGVPALHTMVVGPEGGAKGGTVKVSRVVDDFLISTPRGHPVMQRIEEHLRRAFSEKVKFKLEPNEFAGYAWTRDRRRRLLTVRMTQHVVAGVKRFYPALLEGKRPSRNEAQGLKMHEVCDSLELPTERGGKLTRQQKLVQEITGVLKFPEKVMPVLSLPVHRLARVGSFAPPQAYLAALLVLEHAWDHRHDGLTFGPGEQRLGLSTRLEVSLDEPAPAELQGMADATWGLQKDVFGYVATRHCAAILHGVKNINVICESSYASEGVATQYLVQKLEYVQNIEQAFGAQTTRPTVVGTDSSSNLAVGTKQGAAATRSKHTLRRWASALQRMEDKQIYLVKVDTDNMPADFLTKFLGKIKLQKSLARATNGKLALPPT